MARLIQHSRRHGPFDPRYLSVNALATGVGAPRRPASRVGDAATLKAAAKSATPEADAAL